MAIVITDDCINCGACVPVCPNKAIYEGFDDWRYSDGTDLSGKMVMPNGKEIDAERKQLPLRDNIYFIVPDKCTECKGFHDKPQCNNVCPVKCCVPSKKYVETEEELLAKKSFMHYKS